QQQQPVSLVKAPRPHAEPPQSRPLHPCDPNTARTQLCCVSRVCFCCRASACVCALICCVSLRYRVCDTMSAAVYMRGTDNLMREAMPQTVPSPRGNPCEFGDFDAFDLSLLPGPGPAPLCAGGASSPAWDQLCYAPDPADSEVPYSPTSVQQLVSFFCDASPPPMFPEQPFGKADKEQQQQLQQQDEAPAAAVVKTEPAADQPLLGSCSSWENRSTAFLFSTPVSPPSYIKQEAPQQQQAQQAPQQDASGPQQDERAGDHHLLREVLKDTSFQRKFNLKPFDLGPLAGLGGLSPTLAQQLAPLRRTLSGGSQGGGHGQVKMEDDLPQLDQDAIEPMISLAIQQMRNEIGNTCSMLGIAPDPTLWTPEDVRAWVMWTLRQFSLPPVQLSLFDMEGTALAALTEAELTQRAPQSGSLLFAQLEIWKASCAEDMEPDRTSPAPAPLLHQLEAPACAAGAPEQAVSVCSPHSAHNSSASSADTSDDEDEDMDVGAGGVSGAATPCSSSSSSSSSSRGSHIHLWQFLKELLSSPQLHGSCVRWLDRPGGVFKIEDSVRVARLWGARKNRPAMNYDKLSRSIRQYYKKGIMKKTERSQRLVYQFCHPYSL
ncbi:DNA-binding protein D-ETS-4, partial [Frankliniella fusca]